MIAMSDDMHVFFKKFLLLSWHDLEFNEKLNYTGRRYAYQSLAVFLCQTIYAVIDIKYAI